MERDRRIVRREMDGSAGRRAEFRAEVFPVRVELSDDGGVGAETDIEIFERVVVDEVELDVFVSTAFAGGGIGGAKQVELGGFRLRGLLGLWRLGRFGRSELLREEKDDAQQKVEHIELF